MSLLQKARENGLAAEVLNHSNNLSRRLQDLRADATSRRSQLEAILTEVNGKGMNGASEVQHLIDVCDDAIAALDSIRPV